MSKTLDLQKRAQKSIASVQESYEARPAFAQSVPASSEPKPVLQSAPASAEPQSVPRAVPESLSMAMRDRGDSAKLNRAAISIISLGVLFLLMLNSILFLMLKKGLAVQTSFAGKLDEMNTALRANQRNAEEFLGNLKRMDTELQGTVAKLVDTKKNLNELSDNSVAQGATIDNLTKAKNTLYNRVSELESGMSKLIEERANSVPAAVVQK